MIVGVTGTRSERIARGFINRFADFLLKHPEIEEVHHGDCIGVDQIFQIYANIGGVKTIAHPPSIDRFRAFTKSDVILPPKPYLERNKDIVNACDFLIAAPDGPERVRSGTWSTVRYAKKVGVRGVVWLG